MESENTQTVATFTGTLLKRQRMPGKPFVQLIFREAEKDWLCLSSNLKHVASLQIGKPYKIEGVFKSLGEHQYIHEPEILPIAREIKKRRVLISVGLGLGIVLAAGGIVLAATHDPSAVPRDNPTAPTQQTSTSDDTSTGTAADTTSQTPPADTSTPPVTTSVTTPKKTTTPKTATSTNPTPPPANNQATTPPAPQPHCDPVVFTTLDAQITDDPSLPAGTENVAQSNIDMQTQTCYPDTGTANGTTKTLVAGQPLIETRGTGPADPVPDPGP